MKLAFLAFAAVVLAAPQASPAATSASNATSSVLTMSAADISTGTSSDPFDKLNDAAAAISDAGDRAVDAIEGGTEGNNIFAGQDETAGHLASRKGLFGGNMVPGFI